MVDLKSIDAALNTYVRPQSFPVAVRMCDSSAELPQKVRMPKRDLGISVPACQVIGMARRYGWTMALGREDQVCPHGHAVLGFVPQKGYLDGSVAEKAGVGTKEAFQRDARHLSLLPYGKYSHLLVAPTHKATFEPHIVICFGNPAQVARLVQAATHASGNVLSFVAEGGRGCSVFIARTLITDECQVVLAGAGDRYFALTQDHEMSFTIPMSKADTIITGLEQTHKNGLRYPTPSWLQFEGQLPPTYYKFTELLEKETDH